MCLPGSSSPLQPSETFSDVGPAKGHGIGWTVFNVGIILYFQTYLHYEQTT